MIIGDYWPYRTVVKVNCCMHDDQIVNSIRLTDIVLVIVM